ncbi:DUF3231 family protein [Bacillus sp. DNRA2]|uniref:DUF3231 family protein n=1 Tax=Bacillus sp. DNRA2 TaxID=2723053 RepID=UPI00145C961A|nr:DUF3231 family protein [Bacillus sp. DNRA2]NMD71704.1 DUF3231 family protein [Bacillus sp. DNRA2]
MNIDKSKLTSAEMGKLWATYMGNTMAKCVLRYFLKHVNDNEIKNLLELSLNLTKKYTQSIAQIFEQANFPIPVGFSDEDVNLDAPRLYCDDFYLYYLQYTGKVGISIYCHALSVITRSDISDFFIKCVGDTISLLTNTNNLLQQKGKLMNSPVVPNPNKVDFVNGQDFLNGYLGKVRPLHGLEVAHLYDCLNNDITSRAVVAGFAQIAQETKVKKFMERGWEINKKHIGLMSKKLDEDNLPSPTILDHLVTSSTTPPFSDKIMIAHKIDMFSMKIREYANGASLNGRRDIGLMYARLMMDVSLYVEDGANIMIENGWMELPPTSVNHEDLYH